jgi:rhomboid family GlyGly-CTERM serine protease
MDRWQGQNSANTSRLEDTSGVAPQFITITVRWAIPVIVLTLSLLATYSSGFLRHLFLYDHNAIARGEIWRLITAHLVHTSLVHWALNAAAFVVLWWFFDETWPRQLGLWLLLFLAILTSTGLFLLNPEVQWYAGLSGVLHGLLAAGALRSVLTGNCGYLVLIALLASKLLYEQLLGPLPSSEMLLSEHVIVDAHLYGAIAGAIAAFTIVRPEKYRPGDTPSPGAR